MPEENAPSGDRRTGEEPKDDPQELEREYLRSMSAAIRRLREQREAAPAEAPSSGVGRHRGLAGLDGLRERLWLGVRLAVLGYIAVPTLACGIFGRSVLHGPSVGATSARKWYLTDGMSGAKTLANRRTTGRRRPRHRDGARDAYRRGRSPV